MILQVVVRRSEWREADRAPFLPRGRRGGAKRSGHAIQAIRIRMYRAQASFLSRAQRPSVFRDGSTKDVETQMWRRGLGRELDTGHGGLLNQPKGRGPSSPCPPTSTSSRHALPPPHVPPTPAPTSCPHPTPA
eukprot:6702423-Pyramimonas_sp.AAC.1